MENAQLVHAGITHISKGFPLRDLEVKNTGIIQRGIGSKVCLRPFGYSFEQLDSASKLAVEKLSSSIWTVKEAKAYLTVFCLNEKIISDIITSSRNGKAFRTPAAWRIVPYFTSYPDVPMHLLSLGVGKTVDKDLIRKWLKHRKLFSSFSTGADLKMKSIQQP